MVDGAREHAHERPTVPLLCVVAAAGIGIATWLLLDRRFEPAGWVVLATGFPLVMAGGLVRPTDRLGRMLLSLTDRAFDGFVLGALVWATRTDEPGVAAGALVTLAASFVASYVRARGGSLGYGIEEGVVTPAIRYLLVGGGLITGWTWTIWAAAVVMLLTSGVRASQVAKEERQ